MELTAKTLQEVTFGSSKVRGYNPAEVDQFIEAVAEGVEELRERLRRAVERATRAEQAAATAGETTSAAPAAQGQPEISKVWERAVTAAEEAVSEAKAEADAILTAARDEASRLLTDARNESTRLVTDSRNDADTRIANARQEAESLVSNATTEAARISEESQVQLREDIAKLESARDTLKGDVDGFSSFLSDEKERLRSHMHQALGALDSYGSSVHAAPQNSSYSVPAAAPPVTPAIPSFYESSAPTSTAQQDEPESEAEPVFSETYAEPQSATDAEPANDFWNAADTAVEEDEVASASATEQPVTGEVPLDVPQFSSETVEADEEEPAWGQSEWTAPEPPTAAETDAWGLNNSDSSWGDALPGEPEAPELVGWGDSVEESSNEAAESDSTESASETEADPFLAELRKAVQDDGPLGPRDEADENPIENLYATDDDDDDRSGFFRRNKK